MAYFPLIVVHLLLIALISAAQTNVDDGGTYKLSRVDRRLLEEIIGTEERSTNPPFIMGSSTDVDTDYKIWEQLHKFTAQSRTEFIKTLFRQARYDSTDPDSILRLFGYGFEYHCLEICEFVLVRGVHVEPEFYRVWETARKWSGWVLKRVVERHPERMLELVPPSDWFRIMNHAESIMKLIRFIEYCASINETFAAVTEYRPYNLLDHLLLNQHLCDSDMVMIIQRLLVLGAVVDQQAAEAFLQRHPSHTKAYRLLIGAVEDIKEPDCD